MKYLITLALFTLFLVPTQASAGIKIKGGGWSVTRSDATGYSHQKYDGYEIEASDPDQAQALAKADQDRRDSREALAAAVEKAFSTTPKIVEKVVEKPVYVDRPIYYPVPAPQPVVRLYPGLDYAPPSWVKIDYIINSRRFCAGMDGHGTGVR